MAKVKGGYSGLMRAVLRHMFSERGFNFERGIRLPDGNGGIHLFRARLSCFIQDEKAMKELKSVKGAAGSHCCADCSNVFRGDISKVRGQDWVVHYSEAFPSDFVQYTDQDIWNLADKLETLKPPYMSKS
eukprot:923758-Pyramimonas_sp.AAC.1